MKVLPTPGLGLVHGGISAAQQPLQIGGIVWIQGNADADAGVGLSPLDVEGGVKFLQDTPGRDADRLLTVGTGQHNHELVPSQSGQGIGAANALREPPRHLLEKSVPELVPLGVVDVLEIVEIEEQNGNRLLRTVGQGQGFLQTIQKERTVGQAGECVIIGQLVNLWPRFSCVP